MHIEFLLEEPSTEAMLTIVLPKILGDNISFKLHPFNGKSSLLKKLPNRLKAYQEWLPPDQKLVVLIDEDREDCRKLKQTLEEIAKTAGLITWSDSKDKASFQILNRLAIEELEAWFLGDPDALLAAYPRVDKNYPKKEKYRDPDAITGGTWEALERLLQKAGYYREGLPKIEVAKTVAPHMDPARNQSKSFQIFRDTLQEIIA